MTRQVTRDGDHPRGFGKRVNGEQDHRIGTRRALTFHPITLVQAERTKGWRGWRQSHGSGRARARGFQ
ncbi:MAG: hypothetical protein MZV64_17975 [Ignavibacteriales bacterium]|nr:hypothetical protein [Ignavibacteriales bacterium]